MFDPLNILGRSCICPYALSVRSPDFTNFSPFVCPSVICPRPHHLARAADYDDSRVRVLYRTML